MRTSRSHARPPPREVSAAGGNGCDQKPSSFFLLRKEEFLNPFLKSKVIKRFGQIIRHARSDPNQRLKNKKDF